MRPIKPRSHHVEKCYEDWLKSTSQLLFRCTSKKLMVCEADAIRHSADPNSFGQIQPNVLE